MPITSQQIIRGVTTGAPPAATSLGDQYYLAWTNENATISWTTISVNSAGDGYDVGTIYNPNNPSDLMTQMGCGPALTTFNGQVWMAFLQNPAQAPPISGTDANQPPVIMVTSLSETTWSTPQPLWNPGLTAAESGSLMALEVGAISAPAIASTGPSANAPEADLLIVWVERSLKLPPVGPAPLTQAQIFFTTPQSNTAWNRRQPVKGAFTISAPALVGANGVFYMAWQASDNTVWFATYTTQNGWSDAAQLPNFETSAGPALAVDDSGNVQLVWKGNSDNYIFVATLSIPSGSSWLPYIPGGNWSLQFQMPVVRTALQPALASQLSTPDVLLAFSGATSSALRVVPLSLVNAVSPAPSAANVNYLITNYKINEPLQNITVTVVLNQDLVNTQTLDNNLNPVSTGFSFQLNCQPPGTIAGTGPYPPAGQVVWEQYGIRVGGQIFSMWYENSTSAGLGPTHAGTLFTLPKPNTIPKGYKIEMKLGTAGPTNDVYAFWVNAWDNHNNPILGGGDPGEGKPDVPGPWPILVDPNYLAPILNLQFNIGGTDDGEWAIFQSGSQSGPLATVSYQADSPLMVRGATNRETAESSNITFGLLAAYPSNPIIQNFNTF
jgi:hypothetical protein